MSDTGSDVELDGDAKAKLAEFEKKKNAFDEKLSSISDSDDSDDKPKAEDKKQEAAKIESDDNYSDDDMDMELSKSMKKPPASGGGK